MQGDHGPDAANLVDVDNPSADFCDLWGCQEIPRGGWLCGYAECMTGRDWGATTSQAPTAQAIVTIGKDMTFRDYAQGAFRMRGIGKGQTVHLYIIPEVKHRIEQQLGMGHSGPACIYTGRTELDVPAWLLINSMRMEGMNALSFATHSGLWCVALAVSLSVLLVVSLKNTLFRRSPFAATPTAPDLVSMLLHIAHVHVSLFLGRHVKIVQAFLF